MIEKIAGDLEKYGLLPYVAVFFFFVWAYFAVFEVPDASLRALGALFALAPIWLPISLFIIAKELWMQYIQYYEQVNREYAVLEVKLPSDITQSPRAMELVLNVFYQTGEIDTIVDEYWKGKTSPWFSLEIVSKEGKLHFYIWTRANYKNIIESQLYAHYPGIEVSEVPDYTKEVPYDESKVSLWGIEQRLQNADPYPIQTYVDFGLDKDPKEEYKTDPLFSVLEFMGSLGKGEYMWTQIVIRAHTKQYPKPGSRSEKMRWDGIVRQEIDKILERTKDANGKVNPMALTEGEKKRIEAMQRNANKKPFDTGMRAIYLDLKEVPHPGRNAGIPTMYRSFEHASEGIGYNGLKPQFPTSFAYKLRDPTGGLARARKQELYRSYRMRQFFYWPVIDKRNVFVMSAEELATLYHFPGRAATTPSLERITSRRSTAPANLPL